MKRKKPDILSNGAKVTWPVYATSGKLLKDGTIDGVPMKKVWKQCHIETEKWLKSQSWFKELEKASKKEQAEIDAFWKRLSKKQREKLENTKGTYIT